MNLILWRHAEAEDGENDMKRALTKRGLHQAVLMAGWLKSQLPHDVRDPRVQRDVRQHHR